MKQIFKRLHTTFNVLFAVQVIFCAVALAFARESAQPAAIIVRYTGPEFHPQLLSKAGILALVFLLSVIGVTFMMDRQRRAQGAIFQSLMAKVNHYRQTSIIRLVMIVAANLLAMVLVMRENNMVYFALVAIGLLFFLRFRPTSGKFIRSYQLSPAETKEVTSEK